jgi:hypothetical protein
MLKIARINMWVPWLLRQFLLSREWVDRGVLGHGQSSLVEAQAELQVKHVEKLYCLLTFTTYWRACLDALGMTASRSEHSNNNSGAHIQNPKHGEENYVHEEIVCGMSLRNEA